MNFTPRHFGWLKAPHPERDRMYAPRPELTRADSVRYDHLITAIRDQDATSSCVGHAGVEGCELLSAIEGHPIPKLSPAHAYWNARAVDGFQDEDGGAYIHSCVKALSTVGCCTELEFPLIEPEVKARWGAMTRDERDTYLAHRMRMRASMNAEMSGVKFADVEAQRITGGPEHVADALQLGHVPVIGIQVTSAFVFCNSDETIPAPKPGDVRSGGHALAVVGFDQNAGRFLVQNSWSTDWGMRGLGWLDAGWMSDREASDIHALVRMPKVTA